MPPGYHQDLEHIFRFFWQISLVEIPEHRRKKLMALTTNVMRDDTDKVNIVLLLFCLQCQFEFYVVHVFETFESHFPSSLFFLFII